MKVEFCDDGSCWAEIRPGRSRWFPKNHEVTKAAKAGLILDSLVKTKRAFAAGTHEPVVYYIDNEGKINLPPDAQVPKGFERREIRNLREADNLTREMTREMKERFAFDATPMLDELHRDANGNLPRDLIVKEMNNPKSDYGREVCRGLLEVLDREAEDRQKVQADVHFAWRNS